MSHTLETCLQEVSHDVRAILERSLEGNEVSMADGVVLSGSGLPLGIHQN